MLRNHKNVDLDSFSFKFPRILCRKMHFLHLLKGKLFFLKNKYRAHMQAIVFAFTSNGFKGNDV